MFELVFISMILSMKHDEEGRGDNTVPRCSYWELSLTPGTSRPSMYSRVWSWRSLEMSEKTLEVSEQCWGDLGGPRTA